VKRLRRVFVVLAVVLLVPLAFLVKKALASAAAERAAQHRAVAERILDEMERELSVFLEREENRPFEHYRHTYTDATTPSAAPRRSPLVGPPAERFLFGYFQLGPDGTFASPHLPDPATAVAPDVEVAEWVARVEEIVRFVWKLDDEPMPAQSAGSTVEVLAKRKKSASKTYLGSLNRGAQSRDQRQSKIELTQRQNVLSDYEQQEASSLAVADAVIDVHLEPFVARSASAELGLLVLYRTVLVDKQAYRQGLLIDTTELVADLTDRVLKGSELISEVGITLATSDDDDDSGSVYSYQHRFAEPFGKVTAVLVLEPLPEYQGTTTIYLLSILLALAASVGLFAVYRMTAVVVEFAERRHNFVSAVTHELKTPLTAIRLYGEMLRDGVVPDESKRQRYYEILTAEAERLTRLLQNVLELGQLEKGQRTLSFSVGDVGSVLDDVVAVLGPHAEKEGFVLRVELEKGLGEVRYDRDVLLQVLLNLVDNALKYSCDAATKEVALRARRAQDGVAISVVDHGPGVKREHLGKIFEPFYRGENELTRTTKGTGIGLALVRGLVERMGGSVDGRNGREGGFEVTVLLSGAG
jgi:two-component system phosphate regulon sensor histidine kinase PhoR